MIEGFDIQNFGSFRDFQWNSVRDTPGNNIARFKRLNLLYGRNCAGKTTLSRILRCLETGELPPKYNGPVFTVLSGEGSIAQDQIPSTKHAIRVYNRDFVEKHLAFLRHDDGTIEPFATIGLKNKEIEQAIAEKIDSLGSIESKTGLIHKREEAIAARDKALHAASIAEQSLDAILTKKAASPPDGMKYKPKFGDINYNKAKLRADIRWVRIENVQPLGDDSVRDLEALVGEAALAPIAQRLDFTARLSSIRASAKELLARKIEPTQPIQELLNDALLQSWVREGIVLHKDKRTTCGYCRQPLPIDLWEQLSGHFNKQSVDLDRDISEHLKRIRVEEAEIDAIGRVDGSLVYSQFRERLAILTSELESELTKYRNSLTALASSLHARAGSIFNVQAEPPIEDNSALIAEWVADINSLISESDARTVSLEVDKKRAMTRLRLSEVARFAVDINFDSIEATNEDLRHEASRLAYLASEADAEVRQVEADVRELREQLRDERRGAARINDFLMKHFGHQALRLEAVEEQDTKRFRFRIFRGNELAYNLSEGECSLVAFCYFLAKLEDADTHGKNPIVWIDDPISSLDSNHIFFVFSLIESQLTRPVKGSTELSL